MLRAIERYSEGAEDESGQQRTRRAEVRAWYARPFWMSAECLEPLRRRQGDEYCERRKNETEERRGGSGEDVPFVVEFRDGGPGVVG